MSACRRNASMWLQSKALNSCHLLLCAIAQVSIPLQKMVERQMGNSYSTDILDDVLPFQSWGIWHSYTVIAKSTWASCPLNHAWGAKDGHSCRCVPTSSSVPGADLGMDVKCVEPSAGFPLFLPSVKPTWAWLQTLSHLCIRKIVRPLKSVEGNNINF